MSYIKKFIGHFKTVCTHKKWVYYYMKMVRMPFRGLLHDMSKFSPVEFFEGVKYWQGTSSPIDACKKENGWSRAWMHHKGRNPHHYEYWVDNLDKGGEVLEMPKRYFIELVCDYLGAGRAYMGENFSYAAEAEWWKKKKSNGLAMNPKDIEKLDKIFSFLTSFELDSRFSEWVKINTAINLYVNKTIKEA